MSEPTPTPPAPAEVEAKKARLAEVGAEIERMEQRRPELYAERLALFRWLGPAGVTQAEMGQLARLGGSGVSVVLSQAKAKEAKAAAAAGEPTTVVGAAYPSLAEQQH